MPVILQPYTKTRLSVVKLVSGLSLLEPAQFIQQYFHVHVALGTIDTFRNRTVGISLSNFGSTMRLLQKRMVVAYAVAVPAVLIDLPNRQAGCTL